MRLAMLCASRRLLSRSSIPLRTRAALRLPDLSIGDGTGAVHSQEGPIGRYIRCSTGGLVGVSTRTLVPTREAQEATPGGAREVVGFVGADGGEGFWVDEAVGGGVFAAATVSLASRSGVGPARSSSAIARTAVARSCSWVSRM